MLFFVCFFLCFFFFNFYFFPSPSSARGQLHAAARCAPGSRSTPSPRPDPDPRALIAKQEARGGSRGRAVCGAVGRIWQGDQSRQPPGTHTPAARRAGAWHARARTQQNTHGTRRSPPKVGCSPLFLHPKSRGGGCGDVLRAPRRAPACPERGGSWRGAHGMPSAWHRAGRPRRPEGKREGGREGGKEGGSSVAAAGATSEQPPRSSRERVALPSKEMRSLPCAAHLGLPRCYFYLTFQARFLFPAVLL